MSGALFPQHKAARSVLQLLPRIAAFHNDSFKRLCSRQGYAVDPKLLRGSIRSRAPGNGRENANRRPRADQRAQQGQL